MASIFASAMPPTRGRLAMPAGQSEWRCADQALAGVQAADSLGQRGLQRHDALRRLGLGQAGGQQQGGGSADNRGRRKRHGLRQ